MKQITLLAVSYCILTACSQGYQFGLQENSQSFDQSVTYNNQVDLVFVVDNSSSMSQKQLKLSQTIPPLIDGLLTLKMDFHIAVISTSMGGSLANGGQFLGTPAILTNATPNLKTVLQQRILQGESGSNREAGLESLEKAFSAPHITTGRGKDFLRDGSLLSVIVLSDDDDKSVNDYSHYADFLTSIKPPFDDGTSAWLFNFVGVLNLGGDCNSLNQNNIGVGTAYINLALTSGGVTQSICSADLSKAISNIKARVIEVLTDYKLNRIPNVSTIQVLINGLPVPKNNENGWEYVSSGNLIRFHGSYVPSADAKVVVNFTPATPN